MRINKNYLLLIIHYLYFIVINLNLNYNILIILIFLLWLKKIIYLNFKKDFNLKLIVRNSEYKNNPKNPNSIFLLLTCEKRYPIFLKEKYQK